MTPKPTPVVFPRISRDIDDIRASLFARIEAVQDSFAAKGWLPARLNLNKGVIRGLLELVSWCLWQVYRFMEVITKQAVPHHSTGTWLDLHAEGVGLQRKDETKTTGVVSFYRTYDITNNIIIPEGRILRTLPDGTGAVYRYISTAQTILPIGQESVEVPVVAEEYGAGSNVGPGQICELVTPVVGIGRVSNADEWIVSEGANIESDISLIERIRLQWMGNNGCTKHAYRLWALSVPGVISVEILDKHPRGQGTVGVVVRGSAGLPTEALLERVRDAIRILAPINDEWFVTSPAPVPVTVDACLHYVAGDVEYIKRQTELRILSLFADESDFPEVNPLTIGQDVPLDLLTSTIMSTNLIKRITWTEPTTDVVVPRDGMAVLRSIVFTSAMEEEA